MYFKDIKPGELETLPLNILRHIDIRSREEEEAVQIEVNKRMAITPDSYVPLKFPSSVTDNFGRPGHMTEAEAEEKIQAHHRAFLARLDGTSQPVENIEAAPVDTAPLVEPDDGVIETVSEPITLTVTRPRKKPAK